MFYSMCTASKRQYSIRPSTSLFPSFYLCYFLGCTQSECWNWMQLLSPVTLMDSNEQLMTVNKERAEHKESLCQTSLIMRRDRCGKSVNQFSQRDNQDKCRREMRTFLFQVRKACKGLLYWSLNTLIPPLQKWNCVLHGSEQTLCLEV